jgi:hypothetical protein
LNATTAYADRRRAAPRVRTAPKPRNLAAVQRARDREVALIISFVGDAPWPNPTVHCDPGVRYDWSFLDADDECVVLVRPGLDVRHALGEIYRYTRLSEPIVIDTEAREAAWLVQAERSPLNPSGCWPVTFWPIRRDSETWCRYFTS